jgi:CRISPR-associated protein Cmr5
VPDHVERRGDAAATIIRTMEQRRAQFAWSKVSGIDSSLREEYKDVVRKFPSMVIANGLGQALAFLMAKGSKQEGGAARPDEKSEHGLLYLHLEEWICESTNLIRCSEKGPFRLMRALTEQDSDRYRLVTMESLAIASWLKRFAEALAPD